MDKNEARKIVMNATHEAMAIFRERNKLPARPTQAYFDLQINFINAYIMENVADEIRLAAI